MWPGAGVGLLVSMAHPSGRDLGAGRRFAGGDLHRDLRTADRRLLRLRTAVGPLAVDDSFGGVGYLLQLADMHSGLRDDPGRRRAVAPHEVPQLPARTCVSVAREAKPGSGGMDRHAGMAVLRHRSRSGHRQRHLRRPQRRRGRLDLRDSRRSGPGRSCSGCWASP